MILKEVRKGLLARPSSGAVTARFWATLLPFAPSSAVSMGVQIGHYLASVQCTHKPLSWNHSSSSQELPLLEATCSLASLSVLKVHRSSSLPTTFASATCF